MSRTAQLFVRDLLIDLHNFRTVQQTSEIEAIQAMISISPSFFWGLLESLLEDGYLPTENIIVLEEASGIKCVKEGNRRIASLKILLGIIDGSQFDLPPNISDKIKFLDPKWIQDNSIVPCAIYSATEEVVVDRIVARTHGKGSKAGRDKWEAVATARHNRDKNGATESTLDLLEKYLVHGTNLSPDQKLQWAGCYSLTVLEEAIKKIAKRLGVLSSTELVCQYPNVQLRKALDDIIYEVGIGRLGFPEIRKKSNDFAQRFGIPPSSENLDRSSGTSSDRNSYSSGQSENGWKNSTAANGGTVAGVNTVDNLWNEGSSSTNGLTKGRTQATATTDERSVRKALRTLKFYGQNRMKLETIRKEILKLKLKDNPIAFCFLLRCMFEISAKTYCQDRSGQEGSPISMNTNGNDRVLADVLKDIASHLTKNMSDHQMVKILHGSSVEIQRKDGIFSLTSMNQLVHNPSFTISSTDIPTSFSNIFPLLEQMNK